MHIDIYDSILGRYPEKVYLSNDRADYIDLNKHVITYYDDKKNSIQTVNASSEVGWYRALRFLLINNGELTDSNLLFKEIYEYEAADPKDAESRVENQIKEIRRMPFYKNGDTKISRIKVSNWQLVLPTQKVEIVASKIWETRPFYQDEEYIDKIAKQHGVAIPEFVEDETVYKTARLSEMSYEDGRVLSLDEVIEAPPAELITIRGSFVLDDLFVDGKHLKDITDPFELLMYKEEEITLSMKSVGAVSEIRMLLGGQKAFFPMRHLIQIIACTDKVFYFQILGFADRIGESKYSMKPISIVYI